MKGSSDEIGREKRRQILTQLKVLKLVEYWVYFPISKLFAWGKRSVCQPQTIYSEFPKKALSARA